MRVKKVELLYMGDQTKRTGKIIWQGTKDGKPMALAMFPLEGSAPVLVWIEIEA